MALKDLLELRMWLVEINPSQYKLVDRAIDILEEIKLKYSPGS